MKLNINDLILNYTKTTRRMIDFNMWNGSDAEKEAVLEEVLRKLDGKEIRAPRGEDSKISYIHRTVRRACVDHARYVKSGAYDEIYSSPDDPYHRKSRARGEPCGRIKHTRRRLLQRLLLVAWAQSLRIDLKHFDLFYEYAYGKSRKELAIDHGLTEQQVKGRLEYTRKLIRRRIDRERTRARLRRKSRRR